MLSVRELVSGVELQVASWLKVLRQRKVEVSAVPSVVTAKVPLNCAARVEVSPWRIPPILSSFETPAAEALRPAPMIMLLLPVVALEPAPWPKNRLLEPVLKLPAL